MKTPRSPRCDEINVVISNPNSWAAKVRAGSSTTTTDTESQDPIVPRLKLDEIGEDLEDDEGIELIFQKSLVCLLNNVSPIS